MHLQLNATKSAYLCGQMQQCQESASIFVNKIVTGPWGMSKNIFGLSQFSQDESAWLP